jgi:hypothetical protein
MSTASLRELTAGSLRVDTYHAVTTPFVARETPGKFAGADTGISSLIRRVPLAFRAPENIRGGPVAEAADDCRQLQLAAAPLTGPHLGISLPPSRRKLTFLRAAFD